MKELPMRLRTVLLLVAKLWLVVLVVVPMPALATQCSVTSTSLVFGPVDTLASLGTATSADLEISCSEVPEGIDVITICGHLGPGSDISSGIRQMLGSSDTLGFSLYTDPGHQTPWGHDLNPELGESLRLTLDVVGSEAARTVTLHGLVHGAQGSTVPGNYSATIEGSDASFAFDDGDLANCPHHQTAETTISITAEVQHNCLVQTGDLNFGTVGAIDQNVDAIADIAVSCTPGTGYSISLDGGISGASQPDQRQLQSGSNSLTYGLYRDAERSLPWGEGASVKSGEGIGSEETISVYGRIPPQPVAVGTYTDTVVVTVTYD